MLKFSLTIQGRKLAIFAPGYMCTLFLILPGSVVNGQGYEGNGTLTLAYVVTVLPEFKPVAAKCLGELLSEGLLALESSFASEAGCECRVQ